MKTGLFVKKSKRTYRKPKVNISIKKSKLNTALGCLIIHLILGLLLNPLSMYPLHIQTNSQNSNTDPLQPKIPCSNSYSGQPDNLLWSPRLLLPFHLWPPGSTVPPSPGARPPCPCPRLQLLQLRPPGSTVAPSPGARPPCPCPRLQLHNLRPPGSTVAPSPGARPTCPCPRLELHHLRLPHKQLKMA